MEKPGDKVSDVLNYPQSFGPASVVGDLLNTPAPEPEPEPEPEEE